MEKLEVFLVNLFMLGEIRNTTIIECDGFKFEFKQLNIKKKHEDCINQRIRTTQVTIENINSSQFEQIFEIIDDICWLLSFAQQSPVRCETYDNNSAQPRPHSKVKTMCANNNIIPDDGLAIRKFIKQTYPTFKKLKSSRQLTVVFNYLCEANHPNVALEVSLILHYIIIENLKHTFAKANGFEQKKNNKYFHPAYPDLKKEQIESSCIEEYQICDTKKNLYRHKKFGECGSTEMIKRTFKEVGIADKTIKTIIERRNTIIHEGLLFQFGDKTYSKLAKQHLNEVSSFLREYILKILGYKGDYYSDRLQTAHL